MSEQKKPEFSPYCEWCYKFPSECYCNIVLRPNQDTAICHERIRYAAKPIFHDRPCSYCGLSAADFYHAKGCLGAGRTYFNYSSIDDKDLGQFASYDEATRQVVCTCGAKNRELHAVGCVRVRAMHLGVCEEKPNCVCGTKHGDFHKVGCKNELCPICAIDSKTRCSCGRIQTINEDIHTMTLSLPNPGTYKRLKSRGCIDCGVSWSSVHGKGCIHEVCPIHMDQLLSKCGCKITDYINLKPNNSNSQRHNYNFSGSAGRRQRKGPSW